MITNFTKTKELVIRGKIDWLLPVALFDIEQVTSSIFRDVIVVAW